VRSTHILIGIREGRSPLARAGHRWEDNIKEDCKEMCIVRMCAGFKWMDFMSTVRNLRIKKNKGVEFCD
jgi:hypothetical protein